MGCGDQCPVVPGLSRDDWPLPDPKGRSIDEVRSDPGRDSSAGHHADRRTPLGAASTLVNALAISDWTCVQDERIRADPAWCAEDPGRVAASERRAIDRAGGRELARPLWRLGRCRQDRVPACGRHRPGRAIGPGVGSSRQDGRGRSSLAGLHDRGPRRPARFHSAGHRKRKAQRRGMLLIQRCLAPKVGGIRQNALCEREDGLLSRCAVVVRGDSRLLTAMPLAWDAAPVAKFVAVSGSDGAAAHSA